MSSVERELIQNEQSSKTAKWQKKLRKHGLNSGTRRVSKISELTEQALTVSQREGRSYKIVRLHGCIGSHLLQVEETIDWPTCEPKLTQHF